MSQNTPLRVGIIGAGGNTRSRHLPGLLEITGVTVPVLCNRTEASGRKVASAFGVPNVVTDWRAVVEDPDIDAICIGTWPNMHAELTIAALKAGKHVLCEARMARNLAEAEAMAVAAAAHPERVAQIVPAPFSLNYDATIARLLGEFGALREVNIVHRSGAGADASAPLTWRQDPDLSGKNTHAMGILYETVQRWLGPEVDPAWLLADAELFIKKRPDSQGGMAAVGIPDSISVLGRYNNGAKLTIDLSSIDTAQSINQIRIIGEKGSLRFDLAGQVLYYAKVGATESVVDPDAGTNLGWRVEADFVESIRTGKPVTLTSFADGLRYMRFTDRVWESWNMGSKRLEWGD